MIRFIADSSVLYPAFDSSKGYASELLYLAFIGQAQIVISPYIYLEAQRVLERRSHTALPRFPEYFRIANTQLVANPSPELVDRVNEYVVKKDASVVALAIEQQVDYLVTYDKKHILRDDVIEKSGLNIVIPEDAVKAITGG